jgi:thiamine-monophosphate kinase
MPDENHRARFAHPLPRLREARWLAEHGATGAIDISDGLLADLGHLAAASGVRLEIDLGLLPVMRGVSALQAVASGEEYELAITSREPLDVAAFGAEFGIPLTAIGVAAAGEPSVEATLEGQRVAPIAGHDHLSR